MHSYWAFCQPCCCWAYCFVFVEIKRFYKNVSIANADGKLNVCIIYVMFSIVPMCFLLASNMFSSFCELMQSHSVRCPSVCPSVCKHSAQIAFTRQMAGSQPNLHMMVSRWACIQDVLKVKVEVKGHVMRSLLWFHETHFFSHADDCTLTKLCLSVTNLPFPLSVQFSSASQSPNGCEFALSVPP